MTKPDETLSNLHPFSILILVLPFLLFYWMLPFIGALTIGNDYPQFSTPHQMELMFSIKTGSYPLYIPGFAGGQSSAALTLGQLFHPISWITSHMPGYWSGKALEWNTLFRLISLGLAQLLLFKFFWRLQFNNLLSFLLSFVTVYNLEMLEMFRYGASLEGWTGFLFLCGTVGLYYIHPSRLSGPLLVIASTYWLVCSGHPQIMYYGMLGASLFTLVIPFWVAAVFPEKGADMRSILAFWGRTALFCGAGVILSSAYILPYNFDFVATNAGRVGQGYVWADSFQDTFMGTVNNFFQPLRTSVLVNFGGTALFLVAALAPLFFFLRVKVPRVIMAIWVLALLVFLHMQGDRTPVHYLVWKYLPFASNFRIAGRIAFIMPVLLMLLLGWVFRIDSPPVYISLVLGRKIETNPPIILGFIALLLIFMYLLLTNYFVSTANIYSPVNIRSIPSYVMASNILLGVAALILFCSYNMFKKNQGLIVFILCVVTFVQVAMLVFYGTWLAEKNDTLTFEQIDAVKRQELVPDCYTGVGVASKVVEKQVDRSFLEPFLGKFYPRYAIASDNDAAYAMMDRRRTPDQVVLEGYVPDNRSPVNNPQGMGMTGHIELIYSSYNRLIFDITSVQSGFFGLSYPYTGNWRAKLKGEAVQVYRANGAANAVYLPTGKNRLEFRYWSWPVFWGWLISCAMIIIIGIVISFLIPKRVVGVSIALISIILGSGLFALWYHSLYTGMNLDTRYVWDLPPTQAHLNIAYGKHTETSPFINRPDLKYNCSGSRAVDGDYRPLYRFFAEYQENPWWLVDLSKDYLIDSIVLYKGVYWDNFMLMKPLTLSFSSDKHNWMSYPFEIKEFPMKMVFDNSPIRARYVMISRQDKGFLSLGEVEIFPAVQ
jgi:hypothetical protein